MYSRDFKDEDNNLGMPHLDALNPLSLCIENLSCSPAVTFLDFREKERTCDFDLIDRDKNMVLFMVAVNLQYGKNS